ncbi:MAG: glucose 1-dehydrogenase [Candidatus Latescibacteria bacterium]|nr:glucose 1-dehydrogenase [Candidatus Latescibacterota bacterium]
MRLQDRVALITGSGSGIGQTTAALFAREGARLIIVDIVPERAQESRDLIIQAGGQALALSADVSASDQVEAMAAQALEQWGRIDILVNNAAIVSGDDILDMDEAAWNRDIEVVLNSAVLCSKALVPAMIDQGGGAVVNIASVNALAAFTQMAYSAAKAGIVNLTQNMALSYGPHQVRVNAISPGTIHTPIWDQFLRRDPKILQRLSRWYPLGRIGRPEDVAQAALFLASDEAAWITGQNIVVDGGLTAGNAQMFSEIRQVSKTLGQAAD